jgi:hypothetical protein
MLTNLTGRYYVMYDYSTDSATTQGYNTAYDTFAFLVASFDNEEDALDLESAINHGSLDIMRYPGPWQKISPALGENEFTEDEYNLSKDLVDYRHY